MKKSLKKTMFLLLLMSIIITNVQGQVIKPTLKKPFKPLTRTHFRLPTPFEEIAQGLKQGKCYGVVLTSLYLSVRNREHTLFNKETRHGFGSLVRINDNELKVVLPLQLGVRGTGAVNSLETTLRLKKRGNTVAVEIRNSQYFYLIHNAKIVKKKNGYFITIENDTNNMTISFTFSIFRTDCLI